MAGSSCPPFSSPLLRSFVGDVMKMEEVAVPWPMASWESDIRGHHSTQALRYPHCCGSWSQSKIMTFSKDTCQGPGSD